MIKRLIVGNWKMNPETAAEAKRIANKARRTAVMVASTNVVICPPIAFLAACHSRKNLPNFHLGAQSASVETGGAHTGQVSAVMLRDLGVEYVIAGHSEERAMGDTDEVVSRRLKAILEAGLKAVVCIGEKVRDNEGGSHYDFVREQMRATFAGINPKMAKDVVLAYEPVWAIGVQEAMSPEQIYEMTLFVKKTYADIFGNGIVQKTKVLYGGSANFRNATDIVKTGQVDGLLVGRESVNLAGFTELLKVVDGIS